ncbi:histidine phosphatase family protein [Streptococcus ruminantium]|uniref:histidine phosphatase family protein n=1 Tax=Streptococcus ruminantium TaxID=1917441 RepID=UPI0012DD994C|nr:histidine phosphatase family protein [Streptococcus ruminantium]MDQ8819593.1 histidine phosphatase family protein [Streptococcus ruminantium]MDQ8836182.1 histidine phosphatase family protein [Streptococcus ruminantium]
MAKTIYLMRHGETLFNTQKRVQGWSDSPLTEKGITQAQAVAQYFAERGIVFQSAYSSTQERATDTLKLVTNAPYKQLKELKEMNFGIFEAREEELLPKHRPGARSFEDLLVPFGGEDIRAVGKRVKEAILSVAKLDSADPILMVSHGAAIWGLVQILEVSFPPGVFLSNCAICQLTVEVEKGQMIFEKLIDSAHDFKVYDF